MNRSEHMQFDEIDRLALEEAQAIASGLALLRMEHEEEESEEEEEEEQEEESNDEWKPPTKEEWEAREEALKAARGEAAARRKKIREMENAAKDGDDEKVIEARKEEAERWQKPLVRKEARVALLEAGATKKGLDALVKLIDFAEIHVDDESLEVEGLEDQIESIKEEFPEKFDVKKKVTGGPDSPGTPTGKEDTRSFGQKLVGMGG